LCVKLGHTQQFSREQQQFNNETDNQRFEAGSIELTHAEKEINLLCQEAIEKLEKVHADANKQK
jgi:hypothetical protein